MRIVFTLLIATGVGLVGLTIPGCGNGTVVVPTGSPPAPVTGRSIDLKDTTLAQLDEFVAKQKGKVVLIDCWATTCTPCVKAFPHTIALHEQHEKAGLVVVTVCSDPDDYRAKAAKFLNDRNATCVNFFLSDPKPAKVLEEKYPTDALPAVILFDRAGNRVKAFTFAVDGKELDAEVERLLAGS